jgi:hypothetical protein
LPRLELRDVAWAKKASAFALSSLVDVRLSNIPVEEPLVGTTTFLLPFAICLLRPIDVEGPLPRVVSLEDTATFLLPFSIFLLHPIEV